MDPKDFLKLLLRTHNLKNISRSGWSLVGIQSHKTESVADHSWGTAIIALFLALFDKNAKSNLDISRILMMSIVHDLPESEISDIPSSGLLKKHKQFQKIKSSLEQRAFGQLLHDFSDERIGQVLMRVWKEYVSGETREAKIVRSADILDMLVRARSLENSGTPPKMVDSFFTDSYDILSDSATEFAMEIYRELLDGHQALMKDCD